MSFDVYFVDLRAGETFADAMGRVEDAAEEQPDLTTADLERWESVKAHLRPLLPEAEEFVGGAHRELSDDDTGMQVSLAPGDLSLTVPYWYDGPDARAMGERLRAVAIAIERATGLTAYDPQADAPFLGTGEHTVAATFDQVHAALGRAVEPPAREVDVDRPRRRGLFRRDR